jgi:hypothetical protein
MLLMFFMLLCCEICGKKNNVKCGGGAGKSCKNRQELDVGEQAGRCGKARRMGKRPGKNLLEHHQG